MDFYDQNTQQFVDATINLNMSEFYDKFLSRLPSNSNILDIGCGSGRDLKYFKTKGHHPVGLDPSSKMVKIAQKISGCHVNQRQAQDINENTDYQGIWACASLLHVSHNEMGQVFKQLHRALKPNGIIYCSFKYGNQQREKDGRTFSDYTEKTFNSFIGPLELFSVPKTGIEIWKTNDLRPDKTNEYWLNILLEKSQY